MKSLFLSFEGLLRNLKEVYVCCYTRVILPWNKVEFSRNLLKPVFCIFVLRVN